MVRCGGKSKFEPPPTEAPIPSCGCCCGCGTMPVVVGSNAVTAPPGPMYGFKSWGALEEVVVVRGGCAIANGAASGGCPVPVTVANTDDGWETSGADEAS